MRTRELTNEAGNLPPLALHPDDDLPERPLGEFEDRKGKAPSKKEQILQLFHDGIMDVAEIAYLVNPTLSREEFFQQLADAFGLDPAAGASKAAFLKHLTQTLLVRRNARLNTKK